MVFAKDGHAKADVSQHIKGHPRVYPSKFEPDKSKKNAGSKLRIISGTLALMHIKISHH